VKVATEVIGSSSCRPAKLVENVPIDSASLRVLMMSRFVLAFIAAQVTHDRIGSAQRSFALGQIAKQVKSGTAVLSGDGDIPETVLRLNDHGETTFCLVQEIGAGGKTRMVGSVFQVKYERPTSPTCNMSIRMESVRSRTCCNQRVCGIVAE
jgi:hypothetical protein